MGESLKGTKPFNIRMPLWAIEYIDRRSQQIGTTKTDVVLEALSCLRASDVRGLMRLGYEEMGERNRRVAEQVTRFIAESVPQ